jgi:SAM-dependent methyltransferase
MGDAAKQSQDYHRRRVSLWTIYWFAYFVAFRSISRHRVKDFLRMVLEPCNYWRNVEVPEVVTRLDVKRGERVLDVGSPKFPSLFIWYRLGAEVWATDLFPYFVDEYTHYLSRLKAAPPRLGYHIETQDARGLKYPDCSFDKVYAISVLEHIENDGDSLAMKEIARVLKPGGTCCLTIPFAQKYRESQVEYEIYYKDSHAGKPVFYERHFDLAALESRLIKPSGLTILEAEYFGERWFHFERWSQSLPRVAKLFLSPFGPAFSKVFLHRVGSPSDLRAKTALLTLCKPQ